VWKIAKNRFWLYRLLSQMSWLFWSCTLLGYQKLFGRLIFDFFTFSTKYPRIRFVTGLSKVPKIVKGNFLKFWPRLHGYQKTQSLNVTNDEAVTSSKYFFFRIFSILLKGM
jgi:hypothetical protein